MIDAPKFVLLEATGPRPGALALSFAFSSALVVLAVLLARPLSATPPGRAEVITEIVKARGPLWFPADPPPSEVVPPEPKVASGAASLTHASASDARKAAPDAPPTLPLPRLIEDEAALAASLEALPAARRLAMPRLSIRVDAGWLEALPQTKEELYFSITRPQGDTEVLAYSPVTHGFILKRPFQPLWQIREAEQVPALAALRSDAAARLGVSPELVGLYTWHPLVLENALRMFVLARMEHMGVELRASDVVTVRFASGPNGCLMSLEPIRAPESR